MKPEKGTKAQTRIPHRSRSVGAGEGGVRGRDACDLGGHHLPSHRVSFCLPSSRREGNAERNAATATLD